MEYKFEFQHWFFATDNFKQKQIDNILCIIGNGRLNDFLKFSGYGNISFDENDKGHRYPTIVEQDKYNRFKSNCIIYDMTYNRFNNGKFDKCFIYHSNGNQIGNYGYVFYNTQTGKLSHIYFVEDTYDALCQSLIKSFYSLLKDELWINYYAKKYDCCKKRNGLSMKDMPTISDYKRCKKNLENRLNIGK